MSNFDDVAAADGHVQLVGVDGRPRPQLSTAAVVVVVDAEVVQGVVVVPEPRRVAGLLAEAELKKSSRSNCNFFESR